jgi:hypothetical protein
MDYQERIPTLANHDKYYHENDRTGRKLYHALTGILLRRIYHGWRMDCRHETLPVAQSRMFESESELKGMIKFLKPFQREQQRLEEECERTKTPPILPTKYWWAYRVRILPILKEYQELRKRIMLALVFIAADINGYEISEYEIINLDEEPIGFDPLIY